VLVNDWKSCRDYCDDCVSCGVDSDARTQVLCHTAGRDELCHWWMVDLKRGMNSKQPKVLTGTLEIFGHKQSDPSECLDQRDVYQADSSRAVNASTNASEEWFDSSDHRVQCPRCVLPGSHLGR
jgi:hypothetical protein